VQRGKPRLTSDGQTIGFLADNMQYLSADAHKVIDQNGRLTRDCSLRLHFRCRRKCSSRGVPKARLERRITVDQADCPARRLLSPCYGEIISIFPSCSSGRAF